ncbi:MAG: hypothetical protein EXQ70_08030 [Solirubrobacterales bacterium]|nr:hypothetical protein [Solirubrobacterales bacterium]
MRRLAAIAIAVAIASLALVAGACGSNDQANDYVDDVNAVTDRFDQAVTSVASEAPSASTPSQAGNLLDAFATELDSSAAELEKISPPDDVADLQARMITQIEDLSDQVSASADDLRGASPGRAARELQAFVSKATSEGQQVNATIGQINDKLHE